MKKKPISLVVLLTVLAYACVACGNSQDFSNSNELSKDKASLAAPKGATAHPALMAPSANRK